MCHIPDTIGKYFKLNYKNIHGEKKFEQISSSSLWSFYKFDACVDELTQIISL